MMKNFICVLAVVVAAMTVACQKDQPYHNGKSMEDMTIVVPPFEYASLSDLQNAISDYDPKVGTRAVGVSQLSYAQTVMQEDGYDYQP